MAQSIMFYVVGSSVRPSVRRLSVCLFTPISHDADISSLVQWNLRHVFIVWVGIAGEFFNVRSKVKVILIIVCELYYYNSYSYSLDGAISYVQMCECHTGGGILRRCCVEAHLSW